MKAVILVGGEGTRLRPLTCHTVKAMVPVLNRPFLEHMFEHLKKHNITDIILTLCYLPDCIQSYFGDGRKFGLKLTYVMEKSPLGTAGAVKNAENYLEEPFFVLNGDVFTDLDLTAMLAFHRGKKAKITIALTPVENPTLYGVVETDKQERITQFVEKPSWDKVTTNMINAGTYILQPEILNYIPPQTSYTFEHGVFPDAVRRGQSVYAYPSTAYWTDIGAPEKYLRLQYDLLRQKEKRSGGNELWIEGKSSIHSTAQIKGPVLIGARCVIGQEARLEGPAIIGSGCTLGARSVVQGSVLWDRVRVGQRVVLKNCIVADGSLIEDHSIAEDCVLSHSVTVTRGCRVPPGSKVYPNTILNSATV